MQLITLIACGFIATIVYSPASRRILPEQRSGWLHRADEPDARRTAVGSRGAAALPYCAAVLVFRARGMA